MKKPSSRKGRSEGDDTPRPPAPPAGPEIVIGIGASAGGLPPLQRLLSDLPTGRGLAVVVVQHLEAGADTLLASLLAEKARLKVVEAADGVPIAADHVYVMPAAKSLWVVDGTLSVKDVSQCHGLRMPIDHFFCTLATDQGRRAVGVVLSGTGGDGTHGLAEIKALGGVTAAQDPATAQFAEMPRSAIEGGGADVTLAPDQLAAFLLQRADELAALTAQQKEEAALEDVLAAVRSFTGHDFHCYKHGTLERRIRRRMGLRRLDQYDDYARLLRTDRDEAAAMRKDLLIGVTEFFRQPDAWRVLEDKVVAELVAAAKPQSTLRMWVPACAVGKEAYSLAILMAEAIERSDKKLALQLFATDADATAVDVARAGQYAEDDMKGISQARLRRFFLRKNGRYEVVKQLRELIVFAPQDLTSDPPFSKLDLISCRNLLIYLDPSVQKKIIQLFHFALREGGCLFLGSAENTNGQDNLFDSLSSKWRIYRKLGVTTPVGLDLPLRPASKPAVAIPTHNTPPRPTLPAITHQAIADRYGPPAAVVDRKGMLLYLCGAVEDYLQMPAGEQTGLLADAAREGLRNRLASAVLQAVSENKKVTVLSRVKKERKTVPVKITVSPMRHPREAEGLLLVTFEPQKRPKAAGGPAAGDGEPAHSDLRQIEDELKITREELSSTIEQLEQSNEHLKASNEEVTSANEELQSANEELETSKEELQSLNEELNAVNQRLQDKVVELEQAGNDVTNLLTSGDVATIFLDRQLRVRRFTPAVTKLLSLIDSDIGRPMADITRKFKDDTLLTDARQVLVDLMSATAEVRAENGGWYSRRILPYRTREDRIEGVVVTFNDVTDLKELADALRCSEQTVRDSERRYRLLVQNANSAIIRWSRDGTITFFNEYAESFFGYHADEVVGQPVSILVPPQDSAGADLTTLIQDIVASPEKYVNNVNENVCRDGRRVWMAWTNKPILGPAGQVAEILAVGMDVTARRAAEQALREAHDRARWLARFPEENRSPVVRVSADGVVLYANPMATALPGWRCKVGEPLADRTLLRGVSQALEEGKPADLDIELAGTWFAVTIAPIVTECYANIYGRDITDRKRAEEAQMRLASIVEFSDDAILSKDLNGTILTWNAGAERLFGYKAGEVVGQPVSVLLPPDRRAEEEQILAKLKAGERVEHLETIRLTKDGRRVDVLVTSSPIKDLDGRIIGASKIIHDITDRKQAEAALRDSEAKYRSLFENMQDGFAHCQMLYENDVPQDFVYRDVNSAFERLTGLKGVVGQKVSQVIPGLRQSNPELFDIYGRVARTGRPERFETWVEPLGIWFSISVYSQRRDHFVAVFDNITDRKRAEQALRDSEAKYRNLFENMTEEVHFWKLVRGEDGQIKTWTLVDANPPTLKSWGRKTIEEIRGKTTDEIFGPGAADHYMPLVQKVMADSVPHVYEDYFPNLDKHFRFTTVPLGDYFITTGADITGMKKAQMETVVAGEFLKIINQSTSTRELVKAAVAFFHQQSGCEAVGVRLKEGEDFPYYEAHGFPEDFLLLENSLCERDVDGKIQRDNFGNPCIACMCGNVICGRFDPAKPFFSPNGSFWTNCTSELLATTTEADRQARTRNRCHGQGYESVALVPLRIGEDRLGLLQLNDKRKGLFSAQTISLWERLASYMAVALARLASEEALGQAREGLEVRVKERTAELEQAMAALRTSESRYRTLFETMDEGFCVVEMIYDDNGKPVDYRFVEVNPTFERHTGFQDGLGKTIRQLVPDHDEHWFEIYGKVARTGEAIRFEQIAQAMGRFYDVFAFRIGDAENARVGILFKDITEQKKSQTALREANETLERRVEERTAELVRSNEDLQQFAYLASHDLQEPLRAVTGFAALLKESYGGQLDAKADQWINFITDGSMRMSGLIQDLLAYSRVDRRGLEFAPVNLRDALDDAQANLRAAIGESGAEILAEGLPMVQGDATQLALLFQNLVGNAIKFRREGVAPRIRIGAKQQDGHWSISVQDNGIGIPPEHSERVFMIFQRLHGRSERYPGTGIGLAICKRIVERHGGRIWVESTPGEGSTFNFTIPSGKELQ